MDGLEEKYGAQVHFVRLDIDDATDGQLARKLGAFGHPICIIVNTQGQVVARFAGETARAKLIAALEEVLR